MAKVDISLYDRTYAVACGPGEEARLQEVVAFVDNRMQEIAAQSPGVSESRLFLLTCLTLADELTDVKRTKDKSSKANEDLMVAAVDHLRERILHIADLVEKS